MHFLKGKKVSVLSRVLMFGVLPLKKRSKEGKGENVTGCTKGQNLRFPFSMQSSFQKWHVDLWLIHERIQGRLFI